MYARRCYEAPARYIYFLYIKIIIRGSRVIATEEHTASVSARESTPFYLFNIVVKNKVRNYSNVYYRTVQTVKKGSD